MKQMRNILIYTTALLATLSCIKDDPTDGAPSDVITIAPYVPQTKVAGYILNNDALNAVGNKMVLYDYMRAPGTEANPNGVFGYYMDGVQLQSNGSGWNFTSNTPTAPEFLWIDKSTNSFFGWLDMTGSWYEDVPLPYYTVAQDCFLTIPEITFTKDSPVYDFMYSEVVEIYYEKNPADGSIPITEVPLQMKHLFSAFSIGAENVSEFDVTIHSFRIEDLKNVNSAKIYYQQDGVWAADVDYGTATSSQKVFREYDGAGYTLYAPNNTSETRKNSTHSIFNIDATAREYHLIWPQAASDLYSSESIDSEKIPIEYPESYKLYLDYTTDGKRVTRRLNLPNMPWEAGKRCHVNVVFADKMVDLIASVVPWEQETQTIDFKDSSVGIKNNHYLDWDETTADVHTSTKQIFIKEGQPVKGSFTLDTPKGGTWLVSLEGDVEAFSISPDNGEIDGNTATITVKPLIAEPKRDYKVTLKFVVRKSDGRIIAADEVIQREGGALTKYAIILPSN